MVLKSQALKDQALKGQALKGQALGCVVGSLIAGLTLVSGPAAGEEAVWEPKEDGEVSLPLGRYLELVETAESHRAGDEDDEIPADLVWVDQHLELRFNENEDGDLVEVVELRGKLGAKAVGSVEEKGASVVWPFDGSLDRLEVEGSDEEPSAVWAQKNGKLSFWVQQPGPYDIELEGHVTTRETGRARRLVLPASVAPTSRVVIDLPEGREWTVSERLVVLSDVVSDGRRRLEVSRTEPGPAHVDISHHAASGSRRLLASSVVATLIQLDRAGSRRHDVALFEVSRGELDTLRVDLPEGITVEQAVTDEGPVEWVDPDLRRLELPRRDPLQGRGYVTLTSPLREGVERIALDAVRPDASVRARYLAVVGSMPVSVEPEPADAWLRVDAEDLPQELSRAFDLVDMVTVWRRIEGSAPGELRIVTLPDVPRLESRVVKRSTTSLLTVEGTLLHRDELQLGGVGSALEVRLPAGGVLWSARVGSETVRPIERDGKLLLPLGLADPRGETVELVTVLECAVPAGRSSLEMTLPQLVLPVFEHQWQVLLPKQNRYRLRQSNLSQAPLPQVSGSLVYTTSSLGGPSILAGTVLDEDGSSLPGVTLVISFGGRREMTTTDAQGRFRYRDFKQTGGTWKVRAELEGFNSVESRVPMQRGETANLILEMSVASVAEEIVVTAEAPLHESLNTVKPRWGEKKRSPRRAKPKSPSSAPSQAAAYRSNVAGLQQGLVGGVRPLPVTIPEEGKVLSLVGVLPGAEVSLELDVKGKR